MTLNEYNYLQSRFSRKLKKPDYTSKNAGYNAGISECRSIYETEVDEIVERQKQLQDTLDKILTSLDRIRR